METGTIMGAKKRDEDEPLDEEDSFQPCTECDGHDACADFGCAIKLGLGHLIKETP